jgi:hypothetical protein
LIGAGVTRHASAQFTIKYYTAGMNGPSSPAAMLRRPDEELLTRPPVHFQPRNYQFCR